MEDQDNKTEQLKKSLPMHVAIIMDGNGRWAKKRGMRRVFGHQNAVDAVRSAISVSKRLGIKYLTLFAFSSENWRRPADEIEFLMKLFEKFLDSESEQIIKNGVCLKVIGDISKFSVSLQNKIKKIETESSTNSSLILYIAANYGGRWDIVQACKKLMKTKEINPDELNEDIFAKYLSTENTNIDLMIRTGGERRISNFLIWQLAYAELYTTDVLWPDFNDKTYLDAISWFASRERRFGYTSDQLLNLMKS